MRVGHVITGLETGGGEVLLSRLVEQLDPAVASGPVISLTSRGRLGRVIEEAGVEVSALGMSPRPGPRDLLRLRSAIRDADLDLVQTWLLHSNVLGGLASKPGGPPVVWGIHMTAAERASFGRVSALLQRAEKTLSRWVPRAIVACSGTARDVMCAKGYDRSRIELIENGFDVSRFRPDQEDRASVRAELDISEDAPVVGHFARFHPVKDHATLLRAARTVIASVPDAVFVLCGSGVDASNPEIASMVEGIEGSVRLLGERSDVDRLMRAPDVGVLSSAGEALPLVIGEAMASGMPFVSTDVGDAAAVIGEAGAVVPPGDAAALAERLTAFLRLPRERRMKLGTLARESIGATRSLEQMADAYVTLWRRVLDGR